MVSRTSSILGRPQKLNVQIAKAYHQAMDDIAVNCDYASKTEVVRNAVLMMDAAVELAKAGHQICSVAPDGKQTKLYGTIFAIIQRRASEIAAKESHVNRS